MIPVRVAHKPLSPIARERIARDNATARQDDKFDEGKVLLRRVRTEMVALTQTADIAGRQWRRANDPIPGPTAVGRAQMHPTRAAALAAFVAEMGWSDDPTAPVVAMRTLAETLDAAQAETRARLAAAEAELDEYEAHKHA